MANEEHLARLRQGVKAWNAWRRKNLNVRPDLRAADLAGADLIGVDLTGADLSEACLLKADLIRADLIGVDLTGADLSEACLLKTDLSTAHLTGADLRGALLGGTNFSAADLAGADLRGALLGRAILKMNPRGGVFYETVFANVSLKDVKGLDTCKHQGPSIIDYRTLQRSGPLPLNFLRGCGLPDDFIGYLPSLLNQPIQFYSCFISYSSEDHGFTERLHADLQNKGVRCWFAPHDLRIGDNILDALDEAIHLRDKVLLILSEHSITSPWVEGEVTQGLDEERVRKQKVLFPIRLDDAVLQTPKAWARLLRGQRNIGDFCGWKDHSAYQKSLERLLRDLKVEQGAG